MILIRKDYPTTGVLKLLMSPAFQAFSHNNQEGLPDYWGIETYPLFHHPLLEPHYQEGLPDYWGIETDSPG